MKILSIRMPGTGERKCPKCGKKLSSTAKICPSCGKIILPVVY